MPRKKVWLVSRLAPVWAAIVLLQPFVFGYAVAGQSVSCSPTASQSQQSTPIEIPPAPPPASVRESDCPPLVDRYLPINKTIEARVTTPLDSARLRPGKKIWANSLFEEVDPECHMLRDAVIYGSVIKATFSKKSSASELGLQFDRVDCLGHPALAMKLTLIAIVAPESSRSETVHSVLPGLGISDPYGWDQRLDPGGPPNFVHPGEVVGFKKMSLDPNGGPKCSARLTSADRRIELGLGTVLVLAVPDSDPFLSGP
jgi:hypothetical protein